MKHFFHWSFVVKYLALGIFIVRLCVPIFKGKLFDFLFLSLMHRQEWLRVTSEEVCCFVKWKVQRKNKQISLAFYTSLLHAKNNLQYLWLHALSRCQWSSIFMYFECHLPLYLFRTKEECTVLRFLIEGDCLWSFMVYREREVNNLRRKIPLKSSKLIPVWTRAYGFKIYYHNSFINLHICFHIYWLDKYSRGLMRTMCTCTCKRLHLKFYWDQSSE
jgi:hypothetical protein